MYDFVSNILKVDAPDTNKTSNVIVVDIDEKSLKALGQWPWPRIITAKLIHKINSTHPSAIGLDIIFPEKDRLSPNQITAFYKKFLQINSSMQGIPKNLLDNDIIFSNALSRTQTVLGLYLDKNTTNNVPCSKLENLQLNLDTFDINSHEGILCNTASLASTAKYSGFVNTYLDDDSILRRMPLILKYKDINIPTLSLAMLLNISPEIELLNNDSFKILGHEIVTDKKTNILLNFYEDNWYKKVSIIDLLTNKIPKNTLTGKIVIVASSATSLHDQIIVTGEKKVIGVKIHSTMIDNILNNEYLVQPQWYKIFNILLSLFLSLLFFFLLLRKSKYLLLTLFISSFVAMLLFTSLAYKSGLYISIAYFLVPFIVHFFLVSFIYIIIDTYDKHLFKENLTRLHIADLDTKIKQKTAELVASHKHLQDNINYASLIQRALLPDKEIIQKYTQDSFTFWRPRDTVGGDIYFSSELNSKEELLVMIIDSTGHGVSGAFVTMLVKAIETQVLAEIANNTIKAEPGIILEYFNRSIKTMLKQEITSKSNAGFDGGILYYNRVTNKCTYAGAKTALYIVNGENIKTIKSTRKNVGYIRTKIDQKYTTYDVEIKKGTQLYLTTDGYTDQEGQNNSRLSKEKFINLIKNINNKPMNQQKKDIIRMFDEFKNTHEQSDDVTVIGLQF